MPLYITPLLQSGVMRHCESRSRFAKAKWLWAFFILRCFGLPRVGRTPALPVRR
jgi:hypothetical protein